MTVASVPGTHRAVTAAGHARVLWACTLPVALLGSWTCFAAPPGINWLLWTWAAAAGLLIVRRSTGPHALGIPAGVALAMGCALSAAAAVTADPNLTGLVFLGVAGLDGFALSALLWPGPPAASVPLTRMPFTLGRAVLGEAASRLGETLALLRMQSSVPVLRGAALATTLGAALLLLLSAADPVLAEWRNGAWSLLSTLHFVVRSAFFAALAVLLLGAYGVAARSHPPAPPASGSDPTSPPSRAHLSHLERLMVLGAALGAFVLFFGVDFSTQLGLIRAGQLPAGETLAQATHRGFGEMIVAAGLCAATLILLDRYAQRGPHERRVMRASLAVIAAALVLVIDAYRRVRFYEAAFGYTQLRLDVQAWCAAVFTALLLLGWQVRAAAKCSARLDLPRLARYVALTAVACIAVLSFWNSAAWIVDANFARYQRTGSIDVHYLARLGVDSPDAVPALVRHLPELAPADAQPLRTALADSPMATRLAAHPGGPAPFAWYEWNLRRNAAFSALAAAHLAGSTAR